MKPVFINGIVCWLGVDKGLYEIKASEAESFVSHTQLPINLLVEHDDEIVIGQVTHLTVKNNQLVAYCVVDDLVFLSVLRDLQEVNGIYKSLDIGSFLQIFLPSMSSFHIKGRYNMVDLSLVDRGRRKGTLWQLDNQKKGILCRRNVISPEQLKTKLLYFVLRQRQQQGRCERLCRDADFCGYSKKFITASSLYPLAKSKETIKMNFTPEKIQSMMAIAKILFDGEKDSGEQNAVQRASHEAMYSSNDVKEMLSKLEKKQLDRRDLQNHMEELVHRKAAEQMKTHEKYNNQELSLDDDRYTSMPFNKRYRNIMNEPGKNNAKRAKLNSYANKTDDDSSASDSEEADTKQIVPKTSRHERSGLAKEVREMKGQIEEMMSFVNGLVGDSQKQHRQITEPPKDKTKTTEEEKVTQCPGKSKIAEPEQQKEGCELKGSSLSNKDPIVTLFQ